MPEPIFVETFVEELFALIVPKPSKEELFVLPPNLIIW